MNSGKMPVPPEKLEQWRNSVKLLQAKVTLWEQKLRAAVYKGKCERSIVEKFYRSLETPEYAMQPGDRQLRDNIEAHKSLSDAEENLMMVTISELKAELAITQALIDQVDPPLVTPEKLRLS